MTLFTPVSCLARTFPYVLFSVLLLFSGCASNATSAAEGGQDDAQENPVDPWESVNRRIYDFNMNLDEATLKPVAQGYEKVVPRFARTGVTNFSSNLRGPLNIVNNFLQGKGREGVSETGRLLLNSTVGILGLIDVASEVGLEPEREDFGQTMAVWGVPDGPYVVVPFFGPQTLRDAFALPLDFLSDPLWHYNNDPERYLLIALRLVNLRAGFLSAEELLKESFDPYVRMREAYLQNRRYAVYDGDPPVDEDFYEDFYDDLPEPDPEPEPEPNNGGEDNPAGQRPE
ncbi:MAG: VacJ family lipoprotein [Woeseia sp.]